MRLDHWADVRHLCNFRSQTRAETRDRFLEQFRQYCSKPSIQRVRALQILVDGHRRNPSRISDLFLSEFKSVLFCEKKIVSGFALSQKGFGQWFF